MSKWLVMTMQSRTVGAETTADQPPVTPKMGTVTVNLRRTLAAAATGLALAGAAAGLTPASAAVSNSGTVVTFQLNGSSLAITTPANPAAVQGSVAAASQLTSNLGTTTVTDNSGSLAGWTVTATATDLVKTGSPSVTIPKLNMRYDTLNLTAGAGGTLTGLLQGGGTGAVVAPGPGGPFVSAGGVDVPVVVATALPLAGAGSYDITGRVTLTVPVAAQAGTYTATITQTVA
jgi:hypothetical protein